MSVARALLLVAVVAVATAAGVYVLESRNPLHVAERAFDLDDAAASGPAVDLDEYRRGVRSDEVLGGAVESARATDPDLSVSELRSAVSARIGSEDGAAHLVVRVTAPTADAAVRRLEAVSAALAAWDVRRAPATRALQARLEEEIRATEERIRELQAVGGPAADAEIAELLVVRAERAAQRAQALTGAVDGAPGVLAPGSVTVGEASRRGVERAVFAGSVVAILGCSLVLVGFVRGSARGSVGSSGRSLPVLAEFPAGGPHHAARVAESVRELAKRLSAATGDADRRVFVFTSPDKHDATTTIARALAETLCRPDARTLLVDADLRAPALAREYDFTQAYPTYDDTDRSALVSTTLDWLLDPAASHRVRRVDQGARGELEVVPQFMPALAAGEVLRSGIDAVAARWSEYDTVVVDAGPVLGHGDAAVLAAHASVCVLVVDEERLGRGRLTAARRALRRIGRPVVVALITETGRQLTERAPDAARSSSPSRPPRDPLL